jgi:hypothetical protein
MNMIDPHKERIDNFLKIYKDRYAGPSDTPIGLTALLKQMGTIYENTAYKEYLDEEVYFIHRDHKLAEFDDKFALAVFNGDYGMTEKEQAESLKNAKVVRPPHPPHHFPYDPYSQGQGVWNNDPQMQQEYERMMREYQQAKQQPKSIFGLGGGSK